MKTIIHVFNLETLKENLSTLNKKCEKYGITPIQFQILSSSWVTIENDSQWYPQSIKVQQFEVELSSNDIISINGDTYQFIAKLEHKDLTNLVHVINNVEGFNSILYYVKQTCDHCHTNRKRNFTFVLQNQSTKEFIQLGSSCVKDYLGIDPEVFLYQSELSLFTKEPNFDDPFGSAQKGVDLKAFLLHTIYAIEKFGFVSKKQATESSNQSTGEIALDLLLDKDFKFPSPEWLDKNLLFVDSILSYIQNISPKNDFEHNLKTISEQYCINFNEINFAAFLIQYYLKNNNIELQENSKLIIQSEFFLEVNQKATLQLVVTNIHSTYTSFGWMYIYTFKSEQLPQFTFVYKGKDLNLELNNLYTISFKIKEHNTYKNIKQTIISHPKFI